GKGSGPGDHPFSPPPTEKPCRMRPPAPATRTGFCARTSISPPNGSGRTIGIHSRQRKSRLQVYNRTTIEKIHSIFVEYQNFSIPWTTPATLTPGTGNRLAFALKLQP